MRVCAYAALILLLFLMPTRSVHAAWPDQPAQTQDLLVFISEEEVGVPDVVDLDKIELLETPETAQPYVAGGEWVWQVLPEGLIYSNYLAGNKESRLSGNFINVKEDGWLFDATLGSRVGLLRLGSFDTPLPEGIQLDAEGSAQLRLDVPDNVDVRSVDFRAGMPLTFGAGRYRWKVGYYHLSSHLGDEFMIKHTAYPRMNLVRDVLVFGHMVYLTPRWRVYSEAGWAFNKDVSEPWEFQFGVDYAPLGPTGIRGAPFFAINAHLREEVDFGGSLTVQTGWAWRSDFSTPLLRVGVHYFNGMSNQYSFYNQFEHQIGLGAWYDF